MGSMDMKTRLKDKSIRGFGNFYGEGSIFLVLGESVKIKLSPSLNPRKAKIVKVKKRYLLNARLHIYNSHN